MDMDRKAIELSKYQHIFLLIKLIQLAAGPAHSGQPFYHCLAKKGSSQPSLHNFFPHQDRRLMINF